MHVRMGISCRRCIGVLRQTRTCSHSLLQGRTRQQQAQLRGFLEFYSTIRRDGKFSFTNSGEKSVFGHFVPKALSESEGNMQGTSGSLVTEFTRDLGVDERLEPGLLAEQIVEPTPVQRASIPRILSGGNAALQCYTGSGKTLAYLLPALTRAIKKSEEEWSKVTRKTRGEAGKAHCMIVVPSRELAMQIVRVAHAILPPQAKQSVQQCIGGANIHRQRDALKLQKPIMVVGTPGRLAELSRDGSLQTHHCGILIMDEIDQLLAPQFREEMVRITDHTGKKCEGGRQTVVVSATMTARVLAMCSPWCPNPEKIFIDGEGNTVEPPKEENVVPPSVLAETARVQGEFPSRGWGDPDEVFPEGIPITTSSAGGYGGRASTPSIAPNLSHVYVSSPPQHKVDALRKSLHAVDAQRALVFMNFQHRLKETEAKLKAKKISAASLHGEMTKTERKNALNAFRRGKLRVLLVSDVAARGLDIPECDAVVNLELPSDPSHYAHRAGRTGRAGRDGVVISLVTDRERFVMNKFSSTLGITIDQVENRFGTMLPVRNE
ncbi:DEAD-box ATP-dependent RNA helicase 47 [Picochlorum sp. SENEW3]|nr:DEAD-box ATP-dependent RNA helicase 47 [Picochlorum sp. SENEW3]